MNFVSDPSLVLYLPLYRPDGSPFMSRDAYGHLCTVTGALWRPNGRSFDGDDFINCGQPSVLDFTPQADPFSVMAWVKTTSAASEAILAKGYNPGTASYQYYIFGHAAGYVGSFLGGTYSAGTANIKDGSWHLVAITVPAASSGLVIYVDGNADTFSSGDGSIGGDTNGMDVLVGARRNTNNANTTSFFNGSVGEVWIYSRVLTPLEIQHNYLATKWRYQ